jgi:FkbM family methyltransferase
VPTNGGSLELTRLMSDLEELLSESRGSVERRLGSTLETVRADRLVLFGAGNVCRDALRLLAAHGIRPLAVLDDTLAKQGTRIEGVPILPVADRPADTTAIVTVHNPRHHHPSSVARLGGNVLSFMHLPWLLSGSDFLHATNPLSYFEHSDEIAVLYDGLEDERSRQCLVEQLAFRVRLDWSCLKTDPDPYFPDDVPLPLSQPVSFIDAGAYDGDTLAMFAARAARPRAAIAIEPDPKNFAAMERFAANLPFQVQCLNVAVGAEKGALTFRATGDMSASFDAGGDITVPVTTLTELMAALPYDPLYVKFDIEGAERSVLDASVDVLRTRRPALAVSVYHAPFEIFEIPNLLRALGYKVWLRNHGIDGADLVAYAI